MADESQLTSQEIAAAFGVTVETVEALDERAYRGGLDRWTWNRAVQASARYAQAVNRLMDSSTTSAEALRLAAGFLDG
jgi:hypothetical protein